MSGSVTLLLARHGLTAETGVSLAGRAPGLPLDDRGRDQAEALARRLSTLRLDAVISSPLERCAETAAILARGADTHPTVRTDERFLELDYGDWTGRSLTDLSKEPLWPVVQAHPSAVTFPAGEAMAAAAARAVSAVRDHNATLAARHANPVYLVCSHGDIIKSLLADALGLHLDQFQRIQVDPCSLSVVRYTATRPFVLRVNDTGGAVSGLAPDDTTASGDAVVGGGGGGSTSPDRPSTA
ncbi:MSMEG_4193 family putative phosphomutase [Spiractinospora alimapuensis]|uniref:MSMEG_4193 family putative phosphomutase n=1 Tax=Spiractinospora alimapuensis TaxID=2820884 RepID=UPI001F1C6F82|nr:MSMEG_4193 family putative phosphomutase [Spiractinospora alimapuensis]QVQ52501.1 MSMEG_4193 family putative phosphomutase [Spiractinospora alimapuensis]